MPDLSFQLGPLPTPNPASAPPPAESGTFVVLLQKMGLPASKRLSILEFAIVFDFDGRNQSPSADQNQKCAVEVF